MNRSPESRPSRKNVLKDVALRTAAGLGGLSLTLLAARGGAALVDDLNIGEGNSKSSLVSSTEGLESELNNKYDVQILNNSNKELTEDDIAILDKTLSAIPEGLLLSYPAGLRSVEDTPVRLNVYPSDSEQIQYIGPYLPLGYYIPLSIDGLKEQDDMGRSRGFFGLVGNLAVRKNSFTRYLAHAEIAEVLGGGGNPRDFIVDRTEDTRLAIYIEAIFNGTISTNILTGSLAALYATADESTFIESLDLFIDPANSSSDTKARKIYDIIKSEYFDGKTYSGQFDEFGFPVLSDDSLAVE